MSRLDSLRSFQDKLPPGVADRVRPVVRSVRTAIAARTGTPAVPGPSPYVQWHGPSVATGASPEAALVCTPVADILLLQGRAPAAATVELELADGWRLGVPHRFAHPDKPTGPADCFELTIDHSVLALGGPSSAPASAALVIDGERTSHEVTLPAVPRPGAMVGVETLSQCPACGHTTLTPVGQRQHLQMTVCGQCQLVMTNPRPAEDHTLVRYSERYFEEEYLPSQQLSASLAAHIDAILDHAEPARSTAPTLFELGVGGGNLSTRAAERGWNVQGTDVNPASIAHASSRGLDVWVENADHADSLGGTYGAVISEMSLEHVRRPEHFCALAADALAPGGRLVIYTVSAEGESFEQSGMASPLVGPAEHLFLFSAGSLVALCENVGLRVETVWRNRTGDEIGIVASKRTDVSNPAIR